MSSKNNVNKDFYTIAGRDRPNEDLLMTRTPRDEEHAPRGGARPNFIPGAAPVGESPPEAVAESSAGKTGVRSGSQKKATARRGGTPPGKARPKAGASGDARRRPGAPKAVKRGTKAVKRTTKAVKRTTRRRAA